MSIESFTLTDVLPTIAIDLNDLVSGIYYSRITVISCPKLPFESFNFQHLPQCGFPVSLFCGVSYLTLFALILISLVTNVLQSFCGVGMLDAHFLTFKWNGH